jgi:malate dehydrogenase
VRCRGGRYEIVQGLDLDDFARQKIGVTENELREERDGVADLL